MDCAAVGSGSDLGGQHVSRRHRRSPASVLDGHRANRFSRGSFGSSNGLATGRSRCCGWNCATGCAKCWTLLFTARANGNADRRDGLVHLPAGPAKFRRCGPRDVGPQPDSRFKFTSNSSKAGHGRFYQSAVNDPVTPGIGSAHLAGMMVEDEELRRDAADSDHEPITDYCGRGLVPATPTVTRTGSGAIPTNALTFTTQ